MHAQIVYPKDKLLKEYIQYFLFLDNTDPESEVSYRCFPNTNHCIGLVNKHQLSYYALNEHELDISDKLTSYLTGIYQKPMQFHSKGAFSEVCINFEPMGIEMLTNKKVSDRLFSNHIIEELFPGLEKQIYASAFNPSSVESRAASIESFLLDNMPASTLWQFAPLNKFCDKSVAPLINIFNMSYRTVHRYYKQNLGISPKQFLKICRIRKSIKNLEDTKDYIGTAAISGFSDQSHLIREFRHFTDLTPKRFLNECHVKDKTLWWQFC